MYWLAVDKNGDEFIYGEKPRRDIFDTIWSSSLDWIELPKGSIEKLIGRVLTWEDEPVELS